jgi:hypothetical protein
VVRKGVEEAERTKEKRRQDKTSNSGAFSRLTSNIFLPLQVVRKGLEESERPRPPPVKLEPSDSWALVTNESGCIDKDAASAAATNKAVGEIIELLTEPSLETIPATQSEAASPRAGKKSKAARPCLQPADRKTRGGAGRLSTEKAAANAAATDRPVQESARPAEPPLKTPAPAMQNEDGSPRAAKSKAASPCLQHRDGEPCGGIEGPGSVARDGEMEVEGHVGPQGTSLPAPETPAGTGLPAPETPEGEAAPFLEPSPKKGRPQGAGGRFLKGPRSAGRKRRASSGPESLELCADVISPSPKWRAQAVAREDLGAAGLPRESVSPTTKLPLASRGQQLSGGPSQRPQRLKKPTFKALNELSGVIPRKWLAGNMPRPDI